MTVDTTPQVLIVDDEQGVLNALKRVFRKEPFDVVTMQSPREALELVNNHTFEVIVSDQRMPDMLGAEFLGQCKVKAPDSVRILLTGYSDIHAAVDAVNKGEVFRFMGKPWDDDELVNVVRRGVEQARLVEENKRLQATIVEQNEALRSVNETLEKRVEKRTEEIQTLNEQLRQSLSNSVQVLALLSERHSSMIGSHSKRVAGLAQHIGQALELPDSDLFDLIMAATLHDIGKVGLAPELLNQPEHRLRLVERKQLEQHVIQGEGLIRLIPNMEIVATMVRHHHEQYDGKGFPDHLRGEAIPLGSRIIAVADAYDKLLNDPWSHERKTPEQALELLQNRIGSLYDPSVVEALGRCIADETLFEEWEIEVQPKDLKPDMRLTRDLMSVRGVLMLPKDTVLAEEQIPILEKLLANDPAQGGIYVERASC